MDSFVKYWAVPSFKFLRSIKAHEKSVNSLSISKDGKTFSTSSTDLTAKIWDFDLAEELLVLKSHKKTVIAAELSPDSKYIASGAYDGKIILWNIKTGEKLITLNAFQRNVTSLSFSPNSKSLASGGIGEKFILWDIPSGNKIQEFTEHRIVVSGVKYSPDGEYFVSLGSESLKVWSTIDWELIYEISLEAKFPRVLVISPNSKIIAVGFDFKAQLWNLKSGEPIETIDVKPKGVDSLCFSPDMKFFVMGAADKKIRIWKFI